MDEKSIYDSRKKKLTRTIKEDLPLKIEKVKVGTHSSITTQVYDVPGIKTVFQELKKQREQMLKQLNACNQTMEANKGLKTNPKMEEFLEQLKEAQEYQKNHADLTKATAQHKYALEQLEEVNKQIATLKAAVGEHIKL
jgi:hypothetical protein